MNKCYIVGAGEFYGIKTPDTNDFVIAADGGYNHLTRHGVRCDLLIGDLDSIDGDLPDIETLRFPKRKDETDMFLAYREGVRRGYCEFEIYGATGGRADHTLANYSLLLYAKEAGHRVTLYDKTSAAFVIKNESISLTAKRGCGLSVFAFGGEARGVSIEGAEYEAHCVDLSPAFPLGVSNSYCDGEVVVSVSDGALLIISEF